MDAICPVGEVCVDRASHDSAMIRHSVVKRNEAFSVDRQDGTISRYGIVDTASSAIRRLAFPASNAVTTSCPSSRSLTTVNRGKFPVE
jgi:hypothetical protein